MIVIIDIERKNKKANPNGLFAPISTIIFSVIAQKQQQFSCVINTDCPVECRDIGECMYCAYSSRVAAFTRTGRQVLFSLSLDCAVITYTLITFLDYV